MAQIVVRKLPEEVHNALKARAKRETKSAEAVARDILSDALLPDDQLGFGDRLSALWKDTEGPEIEIDREPYEPIDLT